MLSVIVPVYNVSRFLDRCVRSLLSQTMTDFEVILVDDGSTDNSGAICDDYAQKDPRIHVIHKTNGGLSSARNVGLLAAKGEYIVFIDSDDYVDPSYFETAIGALDRFHCDVFFSNMESVSENGVTHPFYPGRKYKKRPKLLSNKLIMRKMLDNYLITNSACDKVFAKHLWQGESFKVGVKFEDMEVMHRVLFKCKDGIFLNAKFYKYYENSLSITHQLSASAIQDCLNASEGRLAFYREHLPALYRPCLISAYRLRLTVLKMAYSRGLASKEKSLGDYESDFYVWTRSHPAPFFSPIKIRIKLFLLRFFKKAFYSF